MGVVAVLRGQSGKTERCTNFQHQYITALGIVQFRLKAGTGRHIARVVGTWRAIKACVEASLREPSVPVFLAKMRNISLCALAVICLARRRVRDTRRSNAAFRRSGSHN